MALLCTLHADGPKTLRLLREAGCTDLEKLGALGPDRLAKLLNLSPASARRFLREAGLLGERTDPSLEREEVMYAPATSASEVKPPKGALRVEPSVHAAGESRGGLDLRDRALIDKVVDRWRADDDAGETPFDPQPASGEPDPPIAEEHVVMVPTPPGLVAGDLPGLDQELCQHLRASGVGSMEELATCPVDELTRSTGLSFTRARTLQFHAGRALALHEAAEEHPVGLSASPRATGPQRGAPKDESRSAQVERLSLAAPQRLLPTSDRFGAEGDEGAGGPFA